MALAGELAKYIGNELVKTGGKSALSSLVPSAVAKAGTGLATKAGASLLNQATALGLSKNGANKWVMNTATWNDEGGTRALKDFMKPILGGEENPNYQRFLEQIGEGEYRGSLNGHTPGWFDDDGYIIPSTLDNIEGNGDILPKIYGNDREATLRGLLSLGNSGEEARKSASVIANYRGKPNELATIYRQAPKDINYGDWVGLTDSYANLHEGNSEANKLWSKQVPASDVYFAGDDINEWYYMPKEVQLDDELANELEMAIQKSGVKPDVAKRAEKYLGGRMLDKTGKPVTFYHSTPNEFSKFDDKMLGSNTGYDNTKLGHFVTTDKDFSKRFIDIDNTGKTGRTMELQAKIQKPITHPYMAGQKYDEKDLDKIVEDYLIATNNQDGLESLRELAEEDGTSLYDTYMDLTFGGDSPFEYSADDRKALLDNGYDAVEIVEGPKSGLVEGSNDDSIVSSYAVMNGDNLVPVKHIPVESGDYTTLYHGTPKQFEDFDNRLPSVWFSDSDKNLRDTGLSIKGKEKMNVMERRMPKGLKIADEDLADRLTKQQLQDRGYAGIAYTERGPNGDETYYEIFKPNETLEKQADGDSIPVSVKKYLPKLSPMSDDDASMLMENYSSNKANKLNGADTSADELVVRNIAKKNGVSKKTMDLMKKYADLTDNDTYNKAKTALNKLLTRDNKEIDALDKMSRELLRTMGIEYENDMPVVYRATTANEAGSLSYTTDKKIAEKLLKNDDSYKKVIRYVIKPNDIVIAPQFLGPLDTGADLAHIIVKKA